MKIIKVVTVEDKLALELDVWPRHQNQIEFEEWSIKCGINSYVSLTPFYRSESFGDLESQR